MTNSKTPKHTKDTKYVDLLDEDKPIAGQKFACLSFISPEDILKKKEIFFFEKFLKDFDLKKSLDKFGQFLNFIAYKYNIDFNKLSEDLEGFVKEERDNLFTTTLDDEYKTFLDLHEEKLEKEFNEIHKFQTNTRGIKVRGVFETQQEAEQKCKVLRNDDPNHDIYVGPVGVWMPFNPKAYKTGKVEYIEKELNQLMHEKKINEEVTKAEFEKRLKETKSKAIKENVEKASQSGNKLLQSIDDDGNLINADRMDIPGKNLLYGDGENDDVSTADLRKELMESEDVVIKRYDEFNNEIPNDHGLNEILERQKLEDKSTIEEIND